MKFTLIFLLGLGILLGALILNFVSAKLGVMNWYEFIKKPYSATLPSYIWLFIVYPFGLGLVSFLFSRLLSL